VLSKNGKLEWNDRLPVRSPSFLAWTAIKFLLALGIASVIANDIALRFLTIQNYMTQTNSSWAAQIGNYFVILGMRLAGTYQVSPTFGIDNVFTFEVFRLILSLLGLAFIVLGIRLGISIIPNFLVGITKKALGMSRKALSSLFTIILMPLAYPLLTSGTWVYDVGTSFILWNLLIFIVGFAFLAGITRRQRILHFKMTWIKGIIILMIVLAAAIAPPSFATFLRAQSGQYINYQWNPAYVPTIQYTRWAYGVDSVTSAGLSTITSYTNQTNVLNHIRIFTNSSARLNMRPLVGVNWMSIDNAPVDIIYINGTEYWVSILQLVQANYANDVDVWRTQHLLLTHSEKILAVNAATTETVDMSTIWKLTQTPQVYYGEGGLWSSVDEVYLNIPGFNETHLTSYKGPPSYNGRARLHLRGLLVVLEVLLARKIRLCKRKLRQHQSPRIQRCERPTLQHSPAQHANGPRPVSRGGHAGKHLPPTLDLGRLEEPKRLRRLPRTHSNLYSETFRRSPDRCENRSSNRIHVQ